MSCGVGSLRVVGEDPTNRTLIVANLVGKWLEVVPGTSEVRRATSHERS
jgi:hypothetical protein